MGQAAEYLNIPKNTLYKMVSRGEIHVIKITRSNRFCPDLLDKLIKEKTKMPINSLGNTL